MAQTWTDHQLGKPGTGGIENFSARTGFVPAALESTIPFGRGLVYSKDENAENEVVLFGDKSKGSEVFAGFSKYSQEASEFSKEHAGPIANNAVYPIAYAAGDVVGLVDRGSIIVKIASASKGIKAGDRLCVLENGFVDAYKNIASPSDSVGTSKGLLIDAIAESDGKANENISIQIYSLAATKFQYNAG